MRELVLAGAIAAAASAATAQVPIGSLPAERGTVIEGTVEAVFGNRFVLSDETGRVLVSTGPSWFHAVEMREGEALRVVGEPDGAEFDAFRIVRADGEEIEIRPSEGPPPWAGGPRRAGVEPRRGEGRPPRAGGPRARD